MHESVVGTSRTSRDVRFSAAYGGEADIEGSCSSRLAAGVEQPMIGRKPLRKTAIAHSPADLCSHEAEQDYLNSLQNGPTGTNRWLANFGGFCTQGPT